LPPNGRWIYEIKFDGYRMLARFDGAAKPRLFTRNGHDWSSKMPLLIDELAALKLKGTWLDGEVVVLGPDGLPEFNALQNAFDGKATRDITYFVFDVPYFEGHDLRAAPLRERRALLEAFLEQHASEHVRFSSAFDADPVNLMRSAEQLKLEGILAKRDDAPYVSRRTDTWLKLKSQQRQEFVIAGFTDRGGDAAANEIGESAAPALTTKGRLMPAGNRRHRLVRQGRGLLKQRLLKLETPRRRSPWRPPAATLRAPGAWSAGSSRSWWPKSCSPTGRPTAASATPVRGPARRQAGQGK
jgi:bifunctional non-homologous end joining protein LigD